MFTTQPWFGIEPRSTVKATLTRKHPQRTVETPKFMAFARRILRALGRRVGAADVEALPGLVALRAEVDAVIASAVADLRGQHGYSWAEIADRVGVSRQAAQQRWGGR